MEMQSMRRGGGQGCSEGGGEKERGKVKGLEWKGL